MDEYINQNLIIKTSKDTLIGTLIGSNRNKGTITLKCGSKHLDIHINDVDKIEIFTGNVKADANMNCDKDFGECKDVSKSKHANDKNKNTGIGDTKLEVNAKGQHADLLDPAILEAGDVVHDGENINKGHVRNNVRYHNAQFPGKKDKEMKPLSNPKRPEFRPTKKEITTINKEMSRKIEELKGRGESKNEGRKVLPSNRDVTGNMRKIKISKFYSPKDRSAFLDEIYKVYGPSKEQVIAIAACNVVRFIKEVILSQIMVGNDSASCQNEKNASKPLKIGIAIDNDDFLSRIAILIARIIPVDCEIIDFNTTVNTNTVVDILYYRNCGLSRKHQLDEYYDLLVIGRDILKIADELRMVTKRILFLDSYPFKNEFGGLEIYTLNFGLPVNVPARNVYLVDCGFSMKVKRNLGFDENFEGYAKILK